MDITAIRELLHQVQTGARISTAVGEPVQVGERVVIPVAEVAYGGGGGGGMTPEGADVKEARGSGGGGGGGIRIRPLGCWVIGPDEEIWLPAVDVNRLALMVGGIATLFLLTIRALLRR